MAASHPRPGTGGRVVRRVVEAGAVAATLYVLDGTARTAVGSALAYLGLVLVGDLLNAVVGPSADHVVLGLAVLGLVAAVTLVGELWLPLVAAGTVVGGWLLLDGVQHLRHGETPTYDPDGHDGHPVTGVSRALLARVLWPFRLGE